MSKLKNLPIKGAGGGGKDGGGGGRAPIEAPDSLQSIQYAKVMDLLCEGSIVGLVDGARSIYLDDTPLQDASGSYNFSNVIWDARTGEQSQATINGFDGSEAESPVGSEVKFNAPVTRTITNSNNTAVRVTISVPSLTQQNTETGDINGTSVAIGIEVQNNGGGYVALPLRKIFKPDNFSIGGVGAAMNVASTDVNVTVTWTPQAIDAPQTCGYQLEYRLVGNTTWLVAGTHTFSSDMGQTYSPIYGMPSPSIIKTKTFNLQFQSGIYEFRTVKTSGSQSQPMSQIGFYPPPLVGTNYGGSISITYGEIYQPDYQDIISGKASSKYQRAYRVELPAPGPWDIRVKRYTPDSASNFLQNKTFWDSYTEIIDAKLTYPNSALIGIKIDAKQFNNIPVRGYEILGVRVQVPSNYDPLTREYTGVWNGTFVNAWTNNPAWLLYDMVTNDRYGLGQFVDPTMVDKWGLYQIAQYCDEMVDNGFGGIEPRFTANLYLQSQEQAQTVVANICSIFRGMAYWNAGSVYAVQDAPKSPSALFTAANVIDGMFNYSGSSARVRHTVALVAWNDPADAYKQKIEYVEDAAGIQRYGISQTDVIAIGCTSRGQAHRMGRWILYSETYETETISFRAALDAVYVGPGDIIKTHDSNRAGVRFGGRLIDATTSQLTLDAPVTLLSGQTYTISCVLEDGGVEERNISNGAGTHTVITTSSVFPSAPPPHAIWVIGTTQVTPELWRVVSISEVEKTQLEITALSYREDKFGAVEDNLVLQPLSPSLLNASRPQAPQRLQVVESLYLVGLGVVGVRALFSWDSVPGAASYTLVLSKDNESPQVYSGILTNSFDAAPITEGHYSVSVYAINGLGRRGDNAVLDVEILGKSTPPANVSGFSVIKSSGVGIAAWTLHPDLDVQVGGNIVVRHSPLTSGADWEDGIIVEAFSGNAINGIVPLITGTYMVKAIDSSGNWSATTTSFVATEGMVTGFTTVGTVTESLSFTGSMSGVANVGSAIQLASSVNVDSITDLIDTWTDLDSFGGFSLNGTYTFANTIDLTTIATRRFEADITALCFDVGDTIDARTESIDDWGFIDGDVINDCDATLYASVTNDNPAGSPVWGPYTPFFVADFTCRAARFKIDLATLSQSHNIKITQLIVHIKVPV